MSVQKWLGGAGLADLISRVEPVGTGQFGGIDGLGRAAGTGVPPLAIEGQREAGGSGCQQFC